MLLQLLLGQSSCIPQLHPRHQQSPAPPPPQPGPGLPLPQQPFRITPDSVGSLEDKEVFGRQAGKWISTLPAPSGEPQGTAAPTHRSGLKQDRARL